MSDEAFRYAAQVAANESNLTINDFPANWTGEPQDPDDDDDEDLPPDALSPECRELFEAFDEAEEAQGGEAESAASAESQEFSHLRSREIVSTEVEVFRTVALASQGEDEIDEAFSTCGDDIERVMADEINREAIEDGDEFSVTGLEVGFEERELGDWARDMTMSFTYQFGAQDVDASFTFTFVRSGRASGTFMYVKFDETDSAFIDSLRELFAERLEEADESLPD